jgi:hypothetical protein
MEFQISSVIRAADYDGARRTLDIVFKDGSRYTFFEVPDREYEGLIKAACAAEYFKTRIRGKYACAERMERPLSRSKKNAGTGRSRRTLH